jgi:Serine dehydrogenase proteinase
MASWTELLAELSAIPPQDTVARQQWYQQRLVAALNKISTKRGGRNVLFYSSSFLQKPGAPPASLQLTYEEINGFMSCMYGMGWDKGLTLLLHTPGGVTNAAETIVSYLHSKFEYIEVIIPTFAMSAGTMISLAANRILMGRPSQLGPIDPQMPIGGKYVSARGIVDQFEAAKNDISKDIVLAHAWAPILQSLGPSLLVEAQNALDYGERMVSEWLCKRMLVGVPAGERADKAKQAANDAANHKSHGRRISRDEARAQGIVVDDLEEDQELQEAVLSAYHVATICFEQTPCAKMLWSNQGQTWIKNV